MTVTARHYYTRPNRSWANVSRDTDGQLIPDPARFPSGIPDLVRYVEVRREGGAPRRATQGSAANALR